MTPRIIIRGPTSERKHAQFKLCLCGTPPHVRDRNKSLNVNAINECELVETLLELGLDYYPLPDFSSSDYRNCASRLLALTEETEMPITAKYLFIVSMDVEPGKEDLFNEIYDTEHVPNILNVPGVISATRSTVVPVDASIGGSHRTLSAEGEPHYQVIYELESPHVMVSDAWAEWAERGRWPEDVRPFTKNRRHVVRKVWEG